MGNSLPKMRQPTMMYHLMKNGRSLKNISNFSIEFLKYHVKLFEQKEECMTSNLYLYHLHEILSETSGTESFIGTVAKGMLEKLDKYWNNMFEMLAFAAVLDP